jgi:hypothetical protein
MKRRNVLAVVALVSLTAGLAGNAAYAQHTDRTAEIGVSTSGAKHGSTQADYQKVMTMCESFFGGRRGHMGTYRYAYIEQCFKNETGLYPFQLNLNCKIRQC